LCIISKVIWKFILKFTPTLPPKVYAGDNKCSTVELFHTLELTKAAPPNPPLTPQSNHPCENAFNEMKNIKVKEKENLIILDIFNSNKNKQIISVLWVN
jgi:hypothetical protein